MAIHVHIHIRVPFHVHVHFYVQFHVHVHVSCASLAVMRMRIFTQGLRVGWGPGRGWPVLRARLLAHN